MDEGVRRARWLTDSEFDDYVSKLQRLMVLVKKLAHQTKDQDRYDIGNAL